ncbi:MAG: outer membrane lipoprotein chaperone LolA [Legionellaceae bacterium]|nr:outer membrane lipoprotein chaperone LolA [Legionellaceae bacterium]
MLTISRIFCTFVLCVISLSAFADSAEDLQAQLDAMHTYEAQFKQTLLTSKREISVTQGKMALWRPGRFYWKTYTPTEQWIIADGKTLWIYDVDLEQVTAKSQKQGITPTAGLFLSGSTKSVLPHFSISKKQQGSTVIFELKAKTQQAGFQQVRLTFSGHFLQALELKDKLDQQTRILFKQEKWNPTLSKNLFEFHPPKGVDVLRQ